MTCKINRAFSGYGVRGESFIYSTDDGIVSLKGSSQSAPKMASMPLAAGIAGDATVYDGDKELYSFDIESLARFYKPMPDIWSKQA